MRARLPFQEDFTTHLIGTVGPITAEQLEDLGFPYGPTDMVGQTGLEARYEDQLAGRPRTAIVRVNRFGRILENLVGNARDALTEQRRAGVRRRLVLFAAVDAHPLLLHDEPVYRKGELAGRTRAG